MTQTRDHTQDTAFVALESWTPKGHSYEDVEIEDRRGHVSSHSRRDYKLDWMTTNSGCRCRERGSKRSC